MVAELDITDQDVFKIAEMIDDEIAALVPEWKRGPGSEIPQCNHVDFCDSCAASSHNYLTDYATSDNANAKNLQVLQCSKHGCANIHGRFEEITYQVEGTEQCEKDSPSKSNHINYTDIWAQRDAAPEQSLQESIHCNEEEKPKGEEERLVTMDSLNESNSARYSLSSNPSTTGCLPWDDYENEIRKELRWLKAKYQMQLRELRDQQFLGVNSKTSSLQLDTYNGANPQLLLPKGKSRENTKGALKSLRFASHTVQAHEPINGSCGPEQIVGTAKDFYAGSLLHRATSLPVDAVDV